MSSLGLTCKSEVIVSIIRESRHQGRGTGWQSSEEVAPMSTIIEDVPSAGLGTQGLKLFFLVPTDIVR